MKTITNERLAELRERLGNGDPVPFDVEALIAKIDEQDEIIKSLQRVAAGRYDDPDILTAKVYAIDKKHPDSGYQIFRSGRSWKYAWVDPPEEANVSDEDYGTEVEALRAAADDWDNNGGDTTSRIAATLRAVATRAENQES